MSKLACVCAAAALAVVVAAGCGDDDGDDGSATTGAGTSENPTIPAAEIEPDLAARLAADAGVDPAGVTVDCPDGEPAEEGHEFECTLNAADGTTATVEVTVDRAVVTGDQLDYHVDAVVPKSQFK